MTVCSLFQFMKLNNFSPLSYLKDFSSHETPVQMCTADEWEKMKGMSKINSENYLTYLM